MFFIRKNDLVKVIRKGGSFIQVDSFDDEDDKFRRF